MKMIHRGMGYLAGANILDIASIGVTSALLQANASIAASAYAYAHNEVVVHDKTGQDGIKPDGSFQQHVGLIYDGDYGRV